MRKKTFGIYTNREGPDKLTNPPFLISSFRTGQYHLQFSVSLQTDSQRSDQMRSLIRASTARLCPKSHFPSKRLIGITGTDNK